MRAIVSSIFLFIFVVILFLDKDEKKLIQPEPKDQVVFSVYESNESCEIERNEITAIEDRPYAVEKGATLRFWKIQLLKGEKFNFITEQEDPFLKGQSFILAASCTPLTEAQQKENSKFLKETCFKIYRVDRNKQEIKAECGYVTDNKILFLKKK